MHHITPHLPTAKIRIHDDGGEAGLVAVAAEDLAAGEAFATPHLQAVSTQLNSFDGSSSMACKVTKLQETA